MVLSVVHVVFSSKASAVLSSWLVARMSKILFSPRKGKIHAFKRPCVYKTILAKSKKKDLANGEDTTISSDQFCSILIIISTEEYIHADCNINS